jgi:hypothetical protein
MSGPTGVKTTWFVWGVVVGVGKGVGVGSFPSSFGLEELQAPRTVMLTANKAIAILLDICIVYLSVKQSAY